MPDKQSSGQSTPGHTEPFPRFDPYIANRQLDLDNIQRDKYRGNAWETQHRDPLRDRAETAPQAQPRKRRKAN